MKKVILNPLPQKTISEVRAGFFPPKAAMATEGWEDDPLRHLKETYVFIFVVNMIVVQIS